MTDFRDLLPPAVRERIEAQEAAGLSLEEQGRLTDFEARRAERRPVAPLIATDDTEGLFGTAEDPQSGRVHYLLPPEESDG